MGPFGFNPMVNPYGFYGSSPFNSAPVQPQTAGPTGLSWDKAVGIADNLFGQSAGNLVRKIRTIINIQNEIKNVSEAAQNAYQNAAVITDKPIATVQAEAEAMLKDPQFWITHKDAIRDAVILTIANIYIQRNVPPSKLQSMQFNAPQANEAQKVKREIKMTTESE